jgi:hypothetical protein
MPDQERIRERSDRELKKAQRAIVMQLLRDDHEQRWTRAELRKVIPDFSRYRFDQALDFLEGNEVISRDSYAGICASICARALDELGLVGI